MLFFFFLKHSGARRLYELKGKRVRNLGAMFVCLIHSARTFRNEDYFVLDLPQDDRGRQRAGFELLPTCRPSRALSTRLGPRVGKEKRFAVFTLFFPAHL